MRRMLVLLPLMASLGACVDLPKAPGRQGVRQSTATFTPRPESRQCLSELGATRASFTPLRDQYLAPGCSMLNTVRLASLRGDRSMLGVSNLGPVACSLAGIFAGWARYGADRAARQILGSPIARFETMGSYSCRNVAGTGHRSAHATASAIDISGFVLEDGRRITVLASWSGGSGAERQFLRAIHASACRRFGTVLGPGYNAAHADHLHVELGGGGYCR